MAIVVKAPKSYGHLWNKPSIFLAGSIEMGKAKDWQTKVEEALADLDVLILNPRRDDWDSSWVESIENEQFVEQVEWELGAQETTDIICMYFNPDAQSPITLLELGLYLDPARLFVCCPEGFWRKGNVDIVCDRYGIFCTPDLDDLISTVRESLELDLELAQDKAAQISIEDLAHDINKRDDREDPFKEQEKELKRLAIIHDILAKKRAAQQGRDKAVNPSVWEMSNESYSDDNQFEDTDLHLGMKEAIAVNEYEVPERPRNPKPLLTPTTKEYGMGSGPLSDRFEDKTMQSFASEEIEKEESAGQIDVVTDENVKTQNPHFDQDLSIPRG